MPGPVAPGIGMGAGIGLGPTTPGCKVPEPEAVMPMEGFMTGCGAVIGRMVGATGPAMPGAARPPGAPDKGALMGARMPGIAGDGMVGRGAMTGAAVPDIGITPPPLMRVMGPFPMYPPMRLSRILRLAMA